MDAILKDLISKTENYETLILSTDLSGEDYFEIIDEALSEFYTVPLNIVEIAEETIADKTKKDNIKAFFNSDECPISFYDGQAQTYNMPEILTSLALSVKIDERNNDYLHIKTKLVKENTENFFTEKEGSITIIYKISTRSIVGYRMREDDILKIEEQISEWNKKTETQKNMEESFTYNLIMNRT